MTATPSSGTDKDNGRPPGGLRRTVLLFVVAIMPVSAFAAETAGAPLRGLGMIDWLVLVGVAASLVGIGAYYSLRQKTAEDYFMADRNMSPFLVGISFYATICSTLTYLGLPGKVVQNGPIYLIATLVAFPIVYLAVGYLVIPFIGISNLRDGIGNAIYSSLDPVWASHVPTRNAAYSLRAVSRRANSLDASSLLEEAALDKYSFTRDAYLQRRQGMVDDDLNKP